MGGAHVHHAAQQRGVQFDIAMVELLAQFAQQRHIAGGGAPVSRVGLTVQKIMGLGVDGWGKGSMETKSAYTELLV